MPAPLSQRGDVSDRAALTAAAGWRYDPGLIIILTWIVRP